MRYKVILFFWNRVVYPLYWWMMQYAVEAQKLQPIDDDRYDRPDEDRY